MSARARWKQIQAVLGTQQDGIPGRNDAAALEDLRDSALAEYRASKAVAPPVDDGLLVDDRSERNIATLLPTVRSLARSLVRAAAKEGITIKIISGTRTYEQQDALYAQGRTKPGQIVTKARGGYSNHNFGIAFDVGVFEGSDYLESGPAYDRVGKIGKALGLSWGGDWDGFVDKPHFEYNPNGLTLAQMRARKAAGDPVL